MLGFDNAGGEHLEELDRMKVFGRIVLCGIISRYNDTSPTNGPGDYTPRNSGSDFKESSSEIIMKWSSGLKREIVFEGLKNCSKASVALFNECSLA